MLTLSRRVTLTLIGASVTVLAATGVGVASSNQHNAWPYVATSPSDIVLAAVGDIGCEPNTPENAGTPAALRCDESETGNLKAEYATADQAIAMHPQAVALMGDEQYEVGKLSDFQASFDKTWGALKFLQKPAPGNHEFYAYTKHGDNEPAQNGNGYFGYYNGVDANGAIRSQGQAGSDTSANQGWYSYELGDWHVISLNVECMSAAFNKDCSTTGSGVSRKETQWLADDLKANHSSCTMAYWHQPTFSATTSTADAPDPSAPTLAGAEGAAADAWWKLLYGAHADLVLNGHEHVYARFKPMDPHGKVDEHHGIRQFTVGTGGEDLDSLAYESNGAFSNANVVTGEDNAFGVMKFTLGKNRYAWDMQPVGGSACSDTGTGTCHGSAKGHGSDKDHDK